MATQLFAWKWAPNMAFNGTPAHAARFSDAPVGGRRLTLSLGHMRFPAPGERYVRERISAQALQKVLRRVSIALPFALTLVGVGHVWRAGFLSNLAGSYLILVLFSVVLARFMWRRAHDVEAVFGGTRIGPDDEPGVKSEIDYISLVIAAVLLVFALCLPFLPF